MQEKKCYLFIREIERVNIVPRRNKEELYNEEITRRIDDEISELKEQSMVKSKAYFERANQNVTYQEVENLLMREKLLEKKLEAVQDALRIKSEKLDLMNSKRYVKENAELIEESKKFQAAICKSTEKNNMLSKQIDHIIQNNNQLTEKIQTLETINKQLKNENNLLQKRIDDLIYEQEQFGYVGSTADEDFENISHDEGQMDFNSYDGSFDVVEDTNKKRSLMGMFSTREKKTKYKKRGNH